MIWWPGSEDTCRKSDIYIDSYIANSWTAVNSYLSINSNNTKDDSQLQIRLNVAHQRVEGDITVDHHRDIRWSDSPNGWLPTSPRWEEGRWHGTAWLSEQRSVFSWSSFCSQLLRQCCSPKPSLSKLTGCCLCDNLDSVFPWSWLSSHRLTTQ